MNEPLMTVEEVALLLNISEQTVRRYIRRGELKAIKFYRSYRISHEDLRNFITSKYDIDM